MLNIWKTLTYFYLQINKLRSKQVNRFSRQKNILVSKYILENFTFSHYYIYNNFYNYVG